MRRPKLHAICLVRDEDDVVGQTLAFAARHCDRIYVIDNGSADRTWDIVSDLAAVEPRIVPYERTTEPYWDGMRARVYNALHRELREDDWWLILDADEFLAEDPMPLLYEATAAGANVVNAWQIQFYYTDRDYARWMVGPEDATQPIYERRRYYTINWQEPRLFRNDPRRAWDPRRSAKLPDRPPVLHRRRILNRHYQFRDPVQIAKRIALRYGNESFRHHVTSPAWRDYMRPARQLSYYEDGAPWRFTARGLGYYYGSLLRRRVRWTAAALAAGLRRPGLRGAPP